MARAAITVMERLVSWGSMRNFLVRRLAAVRTPAADATHPTTWTHARGTWADGTERDAWLRTGDAMNFTANVASEVAFRLATDAHRPGAFTPCELLGAGLAEIAGAEYVSL